MTNICPVARKVQIILGKRFLTSQVVTNSSSVWRLRKKGPSKVLVRLEMTTEPKGADENVKIDLFEDDDEFEINEEWEDRAEEKEVAEQWEDDWDDDDVHDDFSQQLRKELEINNKKS